MCSSCCECPPCAALLLQTVFRFRFDHSHSRTLHRTCHRVYLICDSYSTHCFLNHFAVYGLQSLTPFFSPYLASPTKLFVAGIRPLRFIALLTAFLRTRSNGELNVSLRISCATVISQSSTSFLWLVLLFHLEICNSILLPWTALWPCRCYSKQLHGTVRQRPNLQFVCTFFSFSN